MFDDLNGTEIAIIGMAGRFPGARDVEAFWSNLRAGVESITALTDQNLLARGVAPDALRDPNLVKAAAVLDDMDLFDAGFFGFTHREAELIDPQHRVLLECAWEALERAGYATDTFDGAIAVYAGAATNTYLLFNLLSHPRLLQTFDPVQIDIASSGDFLATRISYKLNLRGPSHTIQSACSTSLVAVHAACQSLLNEECDIALAGGISINVTHPSGYRYLEGGIVSPDGHCRAFDAHAAGTIFSSGAGVVVLRRLADALAAGDMIEAVIRGSAVNNDGALKVGYTAPSVDGQAAVIAEALSMAAVAPETIGYVEAHGTGTAMGDPIEVQALTRAFGDSAGANGFCALGTVKSNVGHLGAAAGVAGLIKAVLALKHRALPPSLHFERPNPDIDFSQTPFYVNTRLAEWNANGTPRRAGVSSFGVGGTNAHVVVEEAPPPPPSTPGRPWQLLLLSAKTSAGLAMATANLVEYVRLRPEVELADVAYTLQVSRRAFGFRGMLVCRDRDDALHALEAYDPLRVLTDAPLVDDRPVAFLFPGQGAQYVDMARELYQDEPLFREVVDQCCELLAPQLGLDLRTILYPDDSRMEDGRSILDLPSSILHPPSSILHPPSSTLDLDQTQYAQPALFVIEYALARQWMEWGVRPQAMIGHSIGEYVAACLAGVFSLEDALRLVVARGKLMQQLPEGAMLAVYLSAEEAQPYLGQQLAIAAINGPALCVVAGPIEAVEQLEARLAETEVSTRRLHTSHAFHSPTMDAIVEPFAEQVRGVSLNPPQIRYISNLSGTWISAAEATDPQYWGRQLRQTVRFGEGLQELLGRPEQVLLEVGPGTTLSRLIRQHPASDHQQIVLASTRHPSEQQPDEAFLLTTLGKLWLAGVQVDWPSLYRHERRRRIPLPTYPFERQRYWIEPYRGGAARALADEADDPFTPAQAEPVEQPALPGPTHARPNVRTPYLAPRNELEQSVAAIWQELLGIERVGVNDNFFELGGHSLLALQLISQLRDAFQVELPLNDFFGQSTVAGLATIIAANRPEQDELDEIARILAEVESLTADEMLAELAGQNAEGRMQNAEADEPASIHMPLEQPAVVAQGTNGLSEATGRVPAYDLLSETNGAPAWPEAKRADRRIQFSLCYFSSEEEEFTEDKYRLLLEGAKLADHYGFSAIWTPERHFHKFGGLYPSPSTLNAAIAAVTERVQLRAGSVVLPLHHPIRVAEEWSVIDNLSKGRVGVSFASGWHADDFVFYPEHYADRREIMFQGIATVRRLWRGESVTVRGGTGKEIEVKLFPRPVQRELPIWVTAANSPETFVRAGEIGAHVLTAMVELTFEQLAERVQLYREALARHGYDPAAFQVTTMLHTFVGTDNDAVKEKVREPFANYLRSHGSLLRNLAKSLNLKMNLDNISADDESTLIAFAFERYFNSYSLFGTPAKCIQIVDRLKEIGVDEIACLIDFGVDVDSVLESFQYLNELQHYDTLKPDM